MKDNFSTRSENYAKFRPGYPEELFRFIRKNLKKYGTAWDCGTGSGQVAGKIAGFMKRVEATDISRQQISNAVYKPNINYSLQAAEKTNFRDEHFDLITVGQAVHWFDFDKFYEEVKRVLKPDGIIAIIGYSLFTSNPETDKVIRRFYNGLIGPYWDPERKYLEEKYLSIPFPFKEITTPEFQTEVDWRFEQLVGYLKTWSAVKHYEKARKENPVDLIHKELYEAFGDKGKITFPILLRAGRK